MKHLTTAIQRIERIEGRQRLFRTKYNVQVVEGRSKPPTLSTAQDRLTIGSAEQNDLVLKDPAVSRHHLRVELTADGFVLTDLNSTNGTQVGDYKIQQITAPGPVEVQLGHSLIRIYPGDEEEEIELLEEAHFGAVLGQAPSMRELFRKLKSVAKKDVTVLLEGETGTGKELIARELHQQSNRRDGPFIVVDCGAIPPTLIESELFGHERGAFTGATGRRAGAFEDADGGTIFLDEIGELELTMQPRLLRALERREVKPVGATRHRPVNVRVLAATNRDLQRDVNDGTFRGDLFYRLAVVHLRIPPLRERSEDVPLLVRAMLPDAAARVGAVPPKLSEEDMRKITAHHWRGNGRELRNFLERMVALSGDMGEIDFKSELGLEPSEGAQASLGELETLPFREAKARWVEQFDVAYLTRLLDRCNYNIAEAARQSGIDRVHLFRLIKKYQLRK